MVLLVDVYYYDLFVLHMLMLVFGLKLLLFCEIGTMGSILRDQNDVYWVFCVGFFGLDDVLDIGLLLEFLNKGDICYWGND